MALLSITVQFETGDSLEKIRNLIEKDGGKILQSIEIFPPVLNAEASQATIDKIQKDEDVNSVQVEN